MTDWQNRAKSLADKLVASGDLRSIAWRRAFEQVPRHRFVPSYFERSDDGSWQIVDGGRTAHRDHWLDAVYDDEVLVTQVRPTAGSGLPTSSSSMPSIMAWMLEALDVHDGARVLEVGTGTGYNAALLSHRLGEANVTTIDLDPELVALARQRLAEVGYRPVVVVGDGADGYPTAAPYDRIVGTAAVDRIPPAWIEQLAPGGKVMVDVRGSITGGLVLATRVDDDLIEGRFLDYSAAFMPLRSRLDNPHRDGEHLDGTVRLLNPHRTQTAIDPALVSEDHNFRFLLQLHLAGSFIGSFLPDPDDNHLFARGPDGSWVEEGTDATAGLYAVRQGGPRRIWDAVEAAYVVWERCGHPTIDRYGVTATADPDDQYIWLDKPEGPYSWPVPL